VNRFINFPKFVAVSYGGVGSQILLKGILRNLSSSNKGTHLLDHHTHKRDPFFYVGRGTKVIYIFGNPMNAVISFFRRTARKKYWMYYHCKHLEVDHELFSLNWSLEDFLKNGKDLFRLEEHFDNWLHSHVCYPILFVKYETMWEHLPEIFEFLSTASARTGQFPPQKDRESDWRKEPKYIQEGLLNLYGSFDEKLNRFPEIYLLEPSKVGSIYRLRAWFERLTFPLYRHVSSASAGRIKSKALGESRGEDRSSFEKGYCK